MLTSNTILQNRYCIIRQLGKGGMGTVYEAADERLDTIVALKESHFDDEQLRKQFEREARLLARLRHPALTRVIDHFEEGGGQFLVMDLILGDDLWELLQHRGRAFPSDKVLSWASQLLNALEYLHSQKPPIIHRDIKPQNLKLAEQDQIILLDFGLAKGYPGQLSRVTSSGSIFGYTPNYAPLEQIQGTGTDPRSDLYSLAATLYHLITNVPPPDVLARASAVISKQPDPLEPANIVNPQVSNSVAAILEQAMAIDREQRPATATEMRKMLCDISHPSKINSREASISTQQMVIDLPPTQMLHEIAPTIAFPSSTPAHKLSTTPLRKSSAPVQSKRRGNQITLIIGSFIMLFVLVAFISSNFYNRSGISNSESAKSHQIISDEEIKQAILNEIATSAGFTNSDIDIKVDNGIVTLSGLVREDQSELKSKAEDIAKGIQGVKSVINKIGLFKKGNALTRSSRVQ